MLICMTQEEEDENFLCFSWITFTSGETTGLILSKCLSGVGGYQEKMLLPLWKAVTHQLLRESGKGETCAYIPVFSALCSFIFLSFTHFCSTSIFLSVRFLSASVDIPRSSVVPMVMSSGSLMRSNILSSTDFHTNPPTPTSHLPSLLFSMCRAPPSVFCIDHREWTAREHEISAQKHSWWGWWQQSWWQSLCAFYWPQDDVCFQRQHSLCRLGLDDKSKSHLIAFF